MDHFISELLPSMKAPSPDVQLVLLADDTIYGNKLEAAKHLMLCSKYAIKHSVYLVSGLFITNSNLCLCLLDPQGKVVARQAAVHLPPALRATLTPADEIQVIHTELGNLCLCVDTDICYPQIARAAALKGADLLLSIARIDPVEDTPERTLCTIWNAAQSNNLYVAGYSCGSFAVACPAPLTRSRDGYLVRRTAVVPVRFGLNMSRLDDIRSHFQLMEKINTRLVANYPRELGG